MIDLSGKRAVVVGLGKSGAAAARLLRARGATVAVTDANDGEQLRALAQQIGVEACLGDAEARAALEADIVVLSPGVPALPVFSQCEQNGVEVIGELELGVRFLDAPVVAIGGTNGKSTTTKLVAEMLAAAGQSVFVGGNYGSPACEAVGQAIDVAVLEVSSFQLERAPSFKPRVSVLLNVTEDHLDRYASFVEYADAKGNAFVNQTADDVAIFPSADPICEAQARRGAARCVRFGIEVDADYRIEPGLLREASTNARLELNATPLHGRHNHHNLAAALAAARALSAPWDALERAARRFVPLPHRMARVGVVNGVAYYDDSKGTNVGAAVTALLGLAEEKAVLIAGGRDKEGSYAPLVSALKRRGRALVVLGEAAGKIAEAAAGALPVVSVTSMQEAVTSAARLAQSGDAVLLSPACSSFDMYSGYAARGDDFAQCVQALALLKNAADGGGS